MLSFLIYIVVTRLLSKQILLAMNMLDEILEILGGDAVTYEKIRVAGIMNYNWRVACDTALEANLRNALQQNKIEKITIPGNTKDFRGHLFACVHV